MLIAALFAVAILAAVLVTVLRMESRRQLASVARVEGQALGQFVIGLRGFAAAAQAEPSLVPGTPQSGVDWLKAPECGGLASNPVEGYVPCNFTGETFGALYLTTFTLEPVTRQMEFRTTFQVPTFDGGRPQGSTNTPTMLMAEQLVLHALAGQSNPNNGVFFAAFANVAANANAPHDMAAGLPGEDAGRVVAVVTNAPNQDIFLRVDGTNQMLANLNMGGFSISDARDGRFSGDVRVEGQVQVEKGLTVTDGPADFRKGVVADEVFHTGINKYLSEGIYDAEIYTGATSYIIPKIDCTAVGSEPGIYTVLQGTGTPNDGGYTGDAMYSARIDVVDQGSSWRVTPLVQTTKLDMKREGTDIVLYKTVHDAVASTQRILVMRRCR